MIETTFSPCRRYRYTLWRDWSSLIPPEKPGFVQFIGLNPSTADEKLDDPTIRRCMGYARRWGYGAMVMTNLFAFRATDPRVMMKDPAPIGNPENDEWIAHVASLAAISVAAWGTHGTFLNRGAAVESTHRHRLHVLKLTKDEHPQHPLYLPGSLKPMKW